jgi:hypothetical protein
MYLSRFALARLGWYDPAGTMWSAAFALIAVNLFLVSGAAWISFNAYEKRFLRLKRYFPEASPDRPIPAD